MATGAVMELARGLSSVASASLIAAVWQGALLAGAAGLGLRLLPKTPAAARFAIWFAVFVTVAALPLVGVWARPAAVFGVGAGPHAAWITVSSRWSEAVLLVWLAMSLVRAVMLGVGAVRVRELWKRATPVEIAGVTTGVEDQAPSVRRKFQICISDEVDRPSVIGFFAPKILIPFWLVEKLTAEEMAQVVLHEAGHLRRADDWINLLQKIALVIFPLNPALAWVERRLCFERELACDERVLKATGAPKAYASCLTGLAEHRMTRRGMALVMGALGRESELGQRVRRILSRREQMRPMQARFVMVGAVVALVAGVAGLEQCPQLVGFSSGPGTPTKTAAIGGEESYRDVVYRPNTGARAIQTVLQQPMRNGAVHEGGKHVGSTPAVKHPKRDSQRQRSAEEVVTAGQWVVMTSWTEERAGDEARVVMTSIQAGPVASQMYRTAARMTRADGGEDEYGSRVRRVSAVQPQIRQISPYAAVPVSGGWLVIQL